MKRNNSPFRSRRSVPIISTVVLTLLIVGILISSSFMGRGIAEYYAPLMDAATEIKLETTLAYQRYREIGTGDLDFRFREVVKHLDQGEWFARAMLTGEQEQEGRYFSLDDTALRREIEKTLTRLGSLQEILRERFETPYAAGTVPEIDQRYDKATGNCLAAVEMVEVELQWLMVQNLRRLQNTQLLLVPIVVVLGLLIGVILQINEKRHLAYERALRDHEEKLVNSEEKFRTLFESSRDAILLLDREKGFMDCNSAALKMFAVPSKEAFSTLSPTDLAPEYQPDGNSSKELAQRQIDKAEAEGGNFFEWQHRGKDGRIFPATVHLSRIELSGKTLFQCTVRDITQSKEAEETLRKSEHKLAAHIQYTPMGVIECDRNFTITAWNPGAEKIFGYTKEEVVGRDSFDLLIPDYEKERVHQVLLLKGRNSTENINDNKTKDGRIITCQWFNTPMLDGKGELVGMTTACQDISEQIKDQNEIKTLRNRLDNIINSMPSALIAVGTEGRITDWNRKVAEVSGIPSEKAVGETIDAIFPQYRDQFRRIKNAIRSKKPEYIHKIPRRDNGMIYYEDVTIYPLITDGVEGAVIRIDDVTEKARMEEMMIQNEKMLSLGGLAAGMAHEINNPLAGMMQTANVISNRLGGEMNTAANKKAAETAGITLEAIRTFAELRGIPDMTRAIQESGRRIAGIVKNMLSFARKGDNRRSSHDLKKLIDDILELAATDYDLKKKYDFKSIGIRREYEENLPLIPCEGAQIQQVILNILKNGTEAMQEGGTRQPEFIFRAFLDEGQKSIRLEIEDNGPGMDEATSKRVFDPFFTTKPVGVGTGLGLSVSYFIITEIHGGAMSVESTPGQGARFVIRLPVESSHVAS